MPVVGGLAALGVSERLLQQQASYSFAGCIEIRWEHLEIPIDNDEWIQRCDAAQPGRVRWDEARDLFVAEE
jgi:hypothetical protein